MPEISRPRQSLPPALLIQYVLRLTYMHALRTANARLPRVMREVEDQTRVHTAAPRLVGVGAELTFEVIKAAAMLRKMAPSLRVRVMNITDPVILIHEDGHPHALSHEAFKGLFTSDKPIHFNYHGYPAEIQGLLFGKPKMDRISIAGYSEEGSTTSPFSMMVVNGVSRYHVAEAAIRGAAVRNEKIRLDMHEMLSGLCHELSKVQD